MSHSGPVDAADAADAADEARRFPLEHAHYVEDLPHWRALAARTGGPVLDLGAATGRLALTLARDGHEVWALDRSPHMRAELTRRLAGEREAVRVRVRTVDGDLAWLKRASPPLPAGGFRLALIAMNTLQALTDPDDQVRCLAGARALLAPGGELAFDVALPDLAEIAGSLGHERPGGRHVDAASGTELWHSAWYDRLDPLTQTLCFTLRIRSRTRDGERHEALRHHRVHLFMPAELGHLLARAGLEPIEVLGDFAGGPVHAGSERQIYRCRPTSATRTTIE